MDNKILPVEIYENVFDFAKIKEKTHTPTTIKNQKVINKLCAIRK